jgi:membrane protein
MLISIYGLVFDPVTVEPQLQVLRHVVPPAAFALIDDRVHALVSHGAGTLSLSLLISTLLAFWSASSGTRSLLGAMNLAYGEKESRGFIRFQLTALSMTLSAIMGVIVAIALLVALPAALTFLKVESHQAWLANMISFGMMLVMLLGALTILYRYGPSRPAVPWRWVAPGSFAATALWLPASLLFSLYVGHVASYDATYGPLGAVVGLMLWFYVTAYAVLLGAELNSEMEQQQHDGGGV